MSPSEMIPLFKVLMATETHVRVGEVLDSGMLAQGPQVEAFERALEEPLRVPPDGVVTVNSGTSALHLAYHLAGIGRDDIVIATPMTCAATITPLIHLGAQIVWADVDPLTGNISPVSVGELVAEWGDRVKAVVAVDWAGRPADYVELRKVVPHAIPIIEDAAHAFMARRQGRDETWGIPEGPLTSIASYAEADNIFVCYSLQAIKHLTTGDGGILICPSAELTERARKLRWFGLDRRSKTDFRCAQEITEAGYKFHMNDIAAAIGLGNLPSARMAVEQHRNNAMRYHTALATELGPEVLPTAFGALGMPPRLSIPAMDFGSSWWLYTVLVENRDDFTRSFIHARIATSQVHRRNDEHPGFPPSTPGSLPGLDYFSARQVSIPVGWWLTATDLERVTDAVISWAKATR